MNVLSSFGITTASPLDFLTDMIQNSPYALALSVGWIVFSLLLCFFGYRLLKVLCSVGSFAGGGLLCAWLVSELLAGRMIPQEQVPIATGIGFLIGGLLFAYVLFFLYKLLVFVLFAGIGIVIANISVVTFHLSGSAMLGTFAGCALVFGLAGLLFMRPLIILVTACGGFSASSALVALTPLHAMSYASIIVIILGSILTVLGVIVQFRMAPAGTLPGMRKKEEKHHAAAPGERQDDIPEVSDGKKPRKWFQARQKQLDQDADYLVREGLTTPAEFLGASFRRSLLLRPFLKIGPALLLLVCFLLVLSGNPHVEFALLPLILTYAAQSFGVMSLASALLFARSIPALVHAMDAGDVAGSAFCAVSMLVYLILTLWALRAFINHKTGKEFVAHLAPSEEPPAQPGLEATARLAEQDMSVTPDEEPTTILSEHHIPDSMETVRAASTPSDTATEYSMPKVDDMIAELDAAMEAQKAEINATVRIPPVTGDTMHIPEQQDTALDRTAAMPSLDAHAEEFPPEQKTSPIAPSDSDTMPLPSVPSENATVDDTVILGNPAELK